MTDKQTMMVDALSFKEEICRILRKSGLVPKSHDGDFEVKVREREVACAFRPFKEEGVVWLTFVAKPEPAANAIRAGLMNFPERFVLEFGHCINAVAMMQWTEALASLTAELGKEAFRVNKLLVGDSGSFCRVEVDLCSRSTECCYGLVIEAKSALLKAIADDREKQISLRLLEHGWSTADCFFAQGGMAGKIVVQDDSEARLYIECVASSGSALASNGSSDETVLQASQCLPFPYLLSVMYDSATFLFVEGWGNELPFRERMQAKGRKVRRYDKVGEHALRIELIFVSQTTKSRYRYIVDVRGTKEAQAILASRSRCNDNIAKKSSAIPEIQRSLSEVDALDGDAFEHFCARLLAERGYTDVFVTPSSYDGGSDVLATRDLVRFAIQCKHQKAPVGYAAVQQALAGKSYHDCHVAVVLTNSTFTKPTVDYADKVGVVLWNRAKLIELMRQPRMTRVL